MAGNLENRVTVDDSTWFAQEHHVERLLDNSAITAAHPDDTLFVAGPPRFQSDASFVQKLLPVGQVLNFSVNNAAPVQPLTAIGSGRNFYVRGKSTVTGNIGRIFLNGRNLLRVLYTNAVQANVDVSKFDDAAAVASSDEQYFINLDSELFYIPFGLGVLFRDKMRQPIGGYYIELCMINSYSMQVAAGQPLMMENVSFLGDRQRAFTSDFLPKATAGSLAPSFASINEDVLGLGLTMADVIPNLVGDGTRR